MSFITHDHVRPRVQQVLGKLLPVLLLSSLGESQVAEHLIAHEDKATTLVPPAQPVQTSVSSGLRQNVDLPVHKKSM